MKPKKRNRVVFYSIHDGSIVSNLIKIEQLLDGTQEKDNLEINDLLEFYNVKLFFDHNLFLPKWEETTISLYKTKIDENWFIIKNFWAKISNTNVLDLISQVDFVYKSHFWELTHYFHSYKKINTDVFVTLLKNHPREINYILGFKSIVPYFNKEIRLFLLEYSKAAELILSNIELEKHSHASNYIFPSCLTISDKETIINNYIDQPNANPNYIRLIQNSKDSQLLKLSPKLRLKAKRKNREITDEVLSKGQGWKEGVEISLSNTQKESVIYKYDESILIVSYSRKVLDDLQNNISLFYVFSKLFIYTDTNGLLTLWSKPCELDIFERIMMKSKNEYVTGTIFHRKNFLSHLQIIIFNEYLSHRSLSVEKLIEAFIYDRLDRHYGLTNIRFKIPSKKSTYLEKIRALSPEFESILRQYQLYVNDGIIDLELFQLSSSQLYLSEIPSLARKKYFYSNSPKIIELRNLFFSDQSLLHYIEPYNDQYKNLYDLLTNENVNFNQFADYQQDIISMLVKDEYLYINNNNIVSIKKDIMIFLIGELYNNEVITYWNYPISVQIVIDNMLNENLLYHEDTLFTKQELNYFNFYLNKKEFTNGTDLRNKYLHGTNTSFEKEHKRDYFSLLMLIIIALLKIENDLEIKQKSEYRFFPK
ncbi:hypothetical protein [Flavobacterium cerinum]|uniref:Uncharacterized protein n=1 Tax=Flavobacterium cerinum TaxID=2502784 RepID=A0A3S3TV72_9FLAO|nr:hypothetical protein [Flavobacterium cerinum]RWW91963.1 hypothetical protein EPI11_17195 [Flavobacterium cerinum]